MLVDEKNQVLALNDKNMLSERNLPIEIDSAEKKDEDFKKIIAGPRENVHEQKSTRFDHFKNYIRYKSKKIYFDNINSTESYFEDVIKGESVGILIGSVGVSSPANQHQVLEKLSKEIKISENANLIESCEILMGLVSCPILIFYRRFAITNTKLMDLNSERYLIKSIFINLKQKCFSYILY